jgi:hypothetical protein
MVVMGLRYGVRTRALFGPVFCHFWASWQLVMGCISSRRRRLAVSAAFPPEALEVRAAADSVSSRRERGERRAECQNVSRYAMASRRFQTIFRMISVQLQFQLPSSFLRLRRRCSWLSLGLEHRGFGV